MTTLWISYNNRLGKCQPLGRLIFWTFWSATVRVNVSGIGFYQPVLGESVSQYSPPVDVFNSVRLRYQQATGQQHPHCTGQSVSCAVDEENGLILPSCCRRCRYHRTYNERIEDSNYTTNLYCTLGWHFRNTDHVMFTCRLNFNRNSWWKINLFVISISWLSHQKD